MTDSKITKKRYPTGSLARRILTVSVLLLVIPLFFQSLYLYRQEYKQKLSDVQTDLRVLGEERGHLIHEMVEMNWILLDVVSADAEQHVKRFYIDRIPLPQGVPDRFLLASKSREALLVGKRESDASALITSIPFSAIVRDIPSTYPVRFALIDSKGKVLWENRKFSANGRVEIKEPIQGGDISLELSIEKRRVRGLNAETYYFHFATLVFFVGVMGGGR